MKLVKPKKGTTMETIGKAPRTHILRLLGPKTIVCKAFGYFEP